MASQSASNIELSLIAPTYNEIENIVPLVERVHEVLSQYRYELVIVDDNSPDGTADLARTLSEKYPLKVIVRTEERGLASAVVRGFNEASGRVLGVIDADLQHPPEAIPDLLKAIDAGADVVIASRYIPGGGVEGWSIKRKIISQGAKLIANLLLSSASGIRDPLSGFFLFKKEVIDGVALAPTGYKIILEVLAKGHPTQVTEVPYMFRDRERGESNLTFQEELNYLKHLGRLIWYEGLLKRFIKFCVVGASGTFVYMGLLALLTEVAGLFYILSAVLGYEISILNNYTWNELWTFRDRRTISGGSVLTRAIKFNVVSLFGLGIHAAVLAFFTEVVGLFYILSAVIAIIGAMTWNFLANLKWTWRPTSDDPSNVVS
ncbi:MAG: glycosyltransferase family 2 protein [Dehalococcoidia bacterium]|nr:MAG: glycosyltransferase family 2 protein [Dehalococcoidia bacterium]